MRKRYRNQEPCDAKISLRLPGELREQAEQKAAETGLTISGLIVKLLRKLAAGEVELFPKRLPDLTKNPPSEQELIELAKALDEAVQVVKASSIGIDERVNDITSACFRLGVVLKKVARQHDAYSLLAERLFAEYEQMESTSHLEV